jgi:hypothetical protein
MTIVACVKVRDGLALATDSMTQIWGSGQYLGSYENARKLFQVGMLPMGVMTYGLGNLGQRSIESLMREFGATLAGQRSVNTVAKELFDFMKTKHDEQAALLPEGQVLPAIGFYLAGYTRGQVFAEEREFELPKDEGTRAPREKEDFGAAWRGVHAPFFRLSKGYGPVVRERLVAAGITPEQFDQLVADLEINVQFGGMPFQDAVDYAMFILRTTIEYSKFVLNLPPCGGPCQVAAITPEGGFEWLAKPTIRVA